MLDDAKSLVLAKSGREDFVNPEGAPIVYTLRQAGWTDLVDIGDLIKYGPGGVDSPLEPLIGIVGVGANADYVNTNQNTVLRFMSVVWRIIDETKKDPSLFDIQAPYLNSVAGTNLDGKGVARRSNLLDPFTPFDDDKQYYDDTRQRTLLQECLERHHQGLRGAQHRARRQGHAGRRRLGRRRSGTQMVDYKRKTDALFDQARRQRRSSADKKALLDKAKAFYANFDFLDAYRLASRRRIDGVAEAAKSAATPVAADRAASAAAAPTARLACRLRLASALPRGARSASACRRGPVRARLAAAVRCVSPIILPPPRGVGPVCSRISGPRPSLSYYGVAEPNLYAQSRSTPPRTWPSPCFAARRSASLLGLCQRPRLGLVRADRRSDHDDRRHRADPGRRAVPADLVRRRPGERRLPGRSSTSP